ncbi:1,4-dihydroxy-2-naphthoate polyprenyltransferase [Flammeovirga kamogawensis]|uniref:1,4-dihydroxy-2-naphthoate octaprenyltransferase n=1 Tax=Flammeovirga kamogawensis TaxID=373891 RepID=A0ABX8GWP9_9BACT|nr:1,4-dihydroxy-2-naphthoate polyprenyltransferase [Flammeovirga kamogawensis]MBB6461259.1 1,4-dihydroxy-2-naphthoate octaprenyltransferase [Flammeovirga kamogawensis]QWG07818.1 1,4-dihydroxy-2-naphthoate polyprenyltransferase [Flammeovirga kamogawensis]TRX69623.1 1,4-dihydroxy-2-naphthoate polyprenyltransferase [Flammeovirga kamogawensis]
MKAWIQAFRLRTLPLALSSIILGSFLAYGNEPTFFSWEIVGLCVLTTIFLQVLSNLANDYGDSVHGADHEEREGPSRAVQSGKISLGAMKMAIIIFSGLSLSSGLYLLYVSLSSWTEFAYFLGLGVLSIIAAITYTAGKKPYGYAGLGDISVFIFFGLVGVIGSYYLQIKSFDLLLFLPASACGFLAVAVLNVNNIRDIKSDISAGKKSVPVRIGRKWAILYHWVLLFGALICASAYVFYTYTSPFQWLFILTFPLLRRNGNAITKFTEPKDLDPYLKQMALTSLLFSLTFGVGQILDLFIKI